MIRPVNSPNSFEPLPADRPKPSATATTPPATSPSRTRPDGVTETLGYNADNQPTRPRRPHRAPPPPAYDPAGELTKPDSTDHPATQETWTYDPAGQLTNIADTQGAPPSRSYTLSATTRPATSPPKSDRAPAPRTPPATPTTQPTGSPKSCPATTSCTGATTSTVLRLRPRR